MACEQRVGQRHAQPQRHHRFLRARRGAEPSVDLVLRRRPSRGVRVRGQRPDAGRVCARWPGELPHGGCRGRGAEPWHPAQLGEGDDRGRHGHPRDPRRRPGDPKRLQRHQGQVRHRRGGEPRGHRGPRRAVAEALGRVRRGDEPDQRDGAGQLSRSGLPLRTTTVVIGAGHSGLAVSHFLSRRSIDHVVIERGEVANTWRTQRWDALRLLTPNWLSCLPGFAYDGDDPDGFMTMPEVVEFVDRYASAVDAPVRSGTTVTDVRSVDGGYRVTTDDGIWEAPTVMLASGGFNLPHVPDVAAEIP